MNSRVFGQELDSLLAVAGRQQHRACVVLSGSQGWCERAAQFCIERWRSGDQAARPWQLSWIGEPADRAGYLSHEDLVLQVLRPAALKSMLGIDSDCVVIDARAGFSPDTLAIAAGTLAGGACLILLTPEFAHWPDYDDPDYQRYRAMRPQRYAMRGHFIRRFILQLTQAAELQRSDSQSAASISVFDEKQFPASAFGDIQAAHPVAALPAPTKKPFALTDEQQQVVDAIVALTQQSEGSLIVEADRGRGKSVALGYAAKQLLAAAPLKILVTASHRRNVGNVLAVLEEAQNVSIECGIEFIAIDQLIIDTAHAQAPICDLLLVDEAASIPLPVLDQLAAVAPRSVFATTLHGYEGSGRGFALRFKAQLKRRFPDYQSMALRQPLRWSAGDAVEAFFHRLLILDGEETRGPLIPANQLSAVSADSLTVSEIDMQTLVDNEPLLRAIFTLLVDAHYQTRPSDLRQLLDAPYLRLWIAYTSEGQDENVIDVIGVLLACEEGGFDAKAKTAAAGEDLLTDIAAGRRRPQGNLLAQSMLGASADRRWLELSSLRVMRIAVQSQYRRQGVASAMLAALKQHCLDRDMAYWSSSFGFDDSLQAFWQLQGALPVQLGLHLERASGLRNLMVVCPLAAEARQLAAERARQLLADLPYWSCRFLPELDITDLLAWTRSGAEPGLAGDVLIGRVMEDRSTVNRFTADAIGFDRAYPALCRLFGVLPDGESAKQLIAAAESQGPDPFGKPDICPVTVACLRQAPDWGALARQFGLSGRRALISAVKAELIALSRD